MSSRANQFDRRTGAQLVMKITTLQVSPQFLRSRLVHPYGVAACFPG